MMLVDRRGVLEHRPDGDMARIVEINLARGRVCLTVQIGSTSACALLSGDIALELAELLKVAGKAAHFAVPCRD